MQARRRRRGRHRHDGKEGHADRPQGAPPAHRRAAGRVGRQLRADGLRRGRGDGGAGARRARLRLRHQVRAADPHGRRLGRLRRHRRPLAGRLRRLRPPGEFRQVRRPRLPGRGRRDRGRSGRQGPGRQACAVPPARLGHLAPALLGLPDPDDPLRRLRRRAGAGRATAGGAARERRDHRPRLAAGQDGFVLRVQLPEVRQAGEARNRHHGHLRRVVLVLPALRLRRQHDRDGGRARQLLGAGRPVHRRHRARHPAPAVLALLHPRDARLRPGRCLRALQRAAHPGHGGGRNLLPRARRRQEAVDQSGRRGGRA